MMPPPLGSSIVLFARRVARPRIWKLSSPNGTTTEFWADERADFGRDLEPDAARSDHDRQEGQADAERLVLDRHRAGVAVVGHRQHRIFAAGQHAGRLAGDGEQVRFRQRAQQAVRLQQLERGIACRRC